jgi:hypothetical protein
MKRRLVIAVMAVIAGTAGLTACGGPTPPSCAKNQDGISLTAQSECLGKVGDWCQKNYPKDDQCSNRVYGYVPGNPGDSN